ncbi:hypothetical protein [Nocardia altamirensis]|uniref:hypothetical protein n=1 Tax=Nocardia altamirensis TaxID=472158 RepID=UPI0008405460|nr:hypothetical protein [Nocardia altamirensis]
MVIGDNADGDQLVFHPCRPQRLFILPRDDEEVVEAGADLLTAVDKLRVDDELTFEPWDSRTLGSGTPASGATDDPPGQSLDDIVALAEDWANRHAVKTAAQAQLRQQTPEDAKAEQLYEGILFDGPPGTAGYRIAWRIVNNETGTLLGQIYWQHTSGSYGGGWDMETSPTRKYD